MGSPMESIRSVLPFTNVDSSLRVGPQIVEHTTQGTFQDYRQWQRECPTTGQGRITHLALRTMRNVQSALLSGRFAGGRESKADRWPSHDQSVSVRQRRCRNRVLQPPHRVGRSAACRGKRRDPFYTQHLCHALWERTEPQTEVTEDSIRDACRILLERDSFAYTMLWDSLTAHQRRFLTGLALEPAGVKPFSSAFTQRYRLRSASNAQRASQALQERDLIDPENGTFVIVDRFLRLWIRDLQSGF